MVHCCFIDVSRGAARSLLIMPSGDQSESGTAPQPQHNVVVRGLLMERDYAD